MIFCQNTIIINKPIFQFQQHNARQSRLHSLGAGQRFGLVSFPNSFPALELILLPRFMFSISLSLLNKWLFGRGHPQHAASERRPLSSLPLLTTGWHMFLHTWMSYGLMMGGWQWIHEWAYRRPKRWILGRLWGRDRGLELIPMEAASVEEQEEAPRGREDEDAETALKKSHSQPGCCPPMPSLRFYLTRLFPCAAATALDVGLSNSSLQYITLTHYTLLKSSTPLFVLLCACSLNVDGLSPPSSSSSRSPVGSTRRRSRRGSILAVIVGMCLGVMLMVYRDHGAEEVGVTHSGAPVLPPIPSPFVPLNGTDSLIPIKGSTAMQKDEDDIDSQLKKDDDQGMGRLRKRRAVRQKRQDAPAQPGKDSVNPLKKPNDSFYWWLGIGMVLTATVMSALRWALTQILLQGEGGHGGGSSTSSSRPPPPPCIPSSNNTNSTNRRHKKTKSQTETRAEESSTLSMKFQDWKEWARSQLQERDKSFRGSSQSVEEEEEWVLGDGKTGAERDRLMRHGRPSTAQEPTNRPSSQTRSSSSSTNNNSTTTRPFTHRRPRSPSPRLGSPLKQTHSAPSTKSSSTTSLASSTSSSSSHRPLATTATTTAAGAAAASRPPPPIDTQSHRPHRRTRSLSPQSQHPPMTSSTHATPKANTFPHATQGHRTAPHMYPPLLKTMFLLSPLMSACLLLMSLIIERPFSLIPLSVSTLSSSDGQKEVEWVSMYDGGLVQWIYMSSGATLAFCMVGDVLVFWLIYLCFLLIFPSSCTHNCSFES